MAFATILVVDDVPMNRELAVDLLEAAGYAVLQADDGTGLIERVKRDRPELILLDLKLPGVDGFTLAQQLKADPATRAVPIVALTADLMPEKQERAIEAGCAAYLRKPLVAGELMLTVTRLLSPRT